MRNVNLWLGVGIIICAGWFVWLVISPNRYQSLCQVHYWLATPAELDACRDMKSELEK